MTRKQQRNPGGFTIIEVMIVLAIAGLIMAMVFLAVPALNRNAHNEQRRNDVRALLGAVSEYSNNNGGALPQVVTLNGNAAYFCASGTCGPTNGTPINLGYYNAGTVKMSLNALPATAPDTDTVYIVTGYSCQSQSSAPVKDSARSYAAYFAVEPNSTVQCLD